MKSLITIKDKPFFKIGLITEPPDFSFEKQFNILRGKYNFIQIPTLLTDPQLMEEFNTVMGISIMDPLGMLKQLTVYDFYTKFIKLHGEFILKKMSEIEIYKPTVYHLPPMDIEYSKYFNKIVVLTNDGSIDEELFEEHIQEEDFPADVELALLETQRKHFTQLYNTGIWNG
jgi:hypothetical protein